MSRLVALKSEHKQLKLSHANLVELYGRLKHRSTSEVSAIIEQIKSRDEILDMSEHRGRLVQSGDFPLSQLTQLDQWTTMEKVTMVLPPCQNERPP
jgi:hypothetical protein